MTYQTLVPHLPSILFEARQSRPHRGSISGWFARRQERETLRNLSPDTLRDCGLTRVDIAREIERLR